MENGDFSPEYEPFNFDAHAQEAVSAYLAVRALYEDLARSVEHILRECLKQNHIHVNWVNSRAKDPESFRRKAASPSSDDPAVPKYNDPLRQITDLAGVRVIAFFKGTLPEIDQIISSEFDVLERSDKTEALIEEERFGYQSIHYLVKLNVPRRDLPEHRDFKDGIVEIQVRTILQHAWAEIEHDIQYKSTVVIPAEIKRRFMALAGLLELADREFQDIHVEDQRITREARESLTRGDLNVEITPDVLEAYLNENLGTDRRMTPTSYEWAARVLKSLGFGTLAQVASCIDGYDDDQLSQIAVAYKQGQTTRFEHMLLAGMGTVFIERHPFSKEPWWESVQREYLEKFRAHQIPVRQYDPLSP